MDIVPFGLTFLAPCEFRKQYGPDPEHQQHICMKISEAYGHTHGVHAKMCAECMLHGTPDQSFIDKYIAKAKIEQLGLAHLGFYPNAVDIEHILTSLWPYVKHDPKSRAVIAMRLEQLVKLKRLTLEHAEQIVREHLKELQEDEHHAAAEISGVDNRPKFGVGHFRDAYTSGSKPAAAPPATEGQPQP